MTRLIKVVNIGFMETLLWSLAIKKEYMYDYFILKDIGLLDQYFSSDYACGLLMYRV